MVGQETLVAAKTGPRAGSLRRAVAMRSLGILVLVLCVISLGAASFLKHFNESAAEEKLDHALRHFHTRIGAIEQDWQVQADATRSQITFNRILETADPRMLQARFTALAASAGGTSVFTHVVLVGTDGKVVARYRTRSQQDLDLPNPLDVSPAWIFGAQDRTLYRAIGLPVLIGTSKGRLLLYAPLDNALLGRNSFPDTRMKVKWQGQAVAESVANLDTDRTRDGQRLDLGRTLPWTEAGGGPELEISTRLRLPLTTADLLLIVMSTVSLVALLGWLVLGRWLTTQSRRISALETAAVAFAAEKAAGDAVKQALAKADAGASDELTMLAEASGGMMREIETTHTELVRSQLTLAELNASLEKRVADRTADLAAANAELESFSYAVSHDLRSPLRGIDGFSNLLQLNHAAALGPEGSRHLERIRNGVQRMGALIDDLLDLSRVSRADLKLAAVDLSSMAGEIAAGLQQRAEGRQLICSIQPGIHVTADPGLMRVVLENMLGNAFKYTRDAMPARIELGTRRAESGLEIFIRDNGAGFDMEYADKLFEPFQRLHSVRDFEGTGVGLATVARIIKRHRGSVRGEAEVGRGATFYITIPEDGEKA